MPRRLLLELLISAAVAFVLLAAAELVLRTIYPEKIQAYRFDSDYLVELRPNARKVYYRKPVNGGDVVRWQTNRHSFRGPELRDRPELRVVVYGDSNIQARFSPLDRTYPARLQAYLTAGLQKEVEVINGGIIGAGPDQSVLRLTRDADLLKADIVIFHVFTDNDFGDVIRNRLFELSSEGELVRTGLAAKKDRQLSDPKRFLVVQAGLKMLRAMSGGGAPAAAPETPATEQAVADFLSLARDEFAVYRDKKPRAYSHFADRYEYDIALDPDGESAVTKIALMERVLVRAKSIADEKSIKLVVLIQPSSRDLSQNALLNYRFLQRYPVYRPDRLTAIVDEICRRQDIPRIDLYPIFAANDPDSLFFRDANDHWSDAGQDLAARETAAYLLNTTRQRVIPPPPADSIAIGRLPD